MPALETPAGDLGTLAPDFRLPATDGKTYGRDALLGGKGLLLAFVCNHCPYVQAIIERLCETVRKSASLDIGCAAVMSNDTKAYPQDSFENMAKFAEQHAFPFPYLYDESQDLARACGAVCTPDLFLYDKQLALRYRGRLDSGRLQPPPATARWELLAAMQSLAETGKAPQEQIASIGCSIKWKPQ